MSTQVPNDPIMLLSYVNTQLRDFYESLEDFCNSCDLNQDDIVNKLKAVGYQYVKEQNQFK